MGLFAYTYKDYPKIWGYERWLCMPEGIGVPLNVHIKHIVADDWLSLQVHPDDTYAREHSMPNGKTEMWYVTDAQPDASIILGVDAAHADAPIDCLERYRKVPVRRGDVCVIPAGRVHALGAGVQVLEIQQPSDTTYRLYDYDRVGADGKPRMLHLEQAAAVMEHASVAEPLQHYEEVEGEWVEIVRTHCFVTELLRLSSPQRMRLQTSKEEGNGRQTEKRFAQAIVCVEGACKIGVVAENGSERDGDTVGTLLCAEHLIEGPYGACVYVPERMDEELVITPQTESVRLLRTYVEEQ